jgi:hypothetical protein
MLVQPVGPTPTPSTTAARGRSWRLLALALGIIVLLFASTYVLAWYRASSLTSTYMSDADRSYAKGEYLRALSGYEELDEQTGSTITRGGYANVARIWADRDAWPRPAQVTLAQQRIDEIINQHLTIPEAEGFIQVNTGKQNPYLGLVFLRLGELYAEAGDVRSAQEIFEEVPDLFPDEPDLIRRAEEHLQQMNP